MSKLTIYNTEHADLPVLTQVVAHVTHMRPADNITVNVQPRRASGFLEYLAYFWDEDDLRCDFTYFTLACVQRQVGGELEFHS